MERKVTNEQLSNIQSVGRCDLRIVRAEDLAHGQN